MRVPGQAPRPAAVPRHPSARTYATPSTCSDASDPHVAPLQSGMTLMARRPRLPEVRSIAASIGCVPVDRAFLSYRAQRGRSRPPRPHSIARRRHSDLATSHMVRDQRRKCPADSGAPRLGTPNSESHWVSRASPYASERHRLDGCVGERPSLGVVAPHEASARVAGRKGPTLAC